MLKTDAIVGGVHFFPDDAAHTVASKALRVNLSDLAAKGARRLAFVLALPRRGRVAGGIFLKDYAATQCYLPVHLAATPFARRVRSRFPSLCWEAFLRERWCVAPAKPGDRVFVSGTLGDAALGVMLRNGRNWKLGNPERQHLISRHLCHSREMQWQRLCAHILRLQWMCPTALSWRFCQAFAGVGVCADIEVARVPLSDAASGHCCRLRNA